MKTLLIVVMVSLSGCATMLENWRAANAREEEYRRTHPEYICKTDTSGHSNGGFYSGDSTTICKQR